MKLFDSIPIKRPKRNKFDLSHEVKLTGAMGELMPVYVEEIIPGDKFKVKSEIFMRMAPMVAPIMQRVNTYTHYFFVPNRIIWDNWEKFITGGEDGTTAPVLPYIVMDEANKAYFIPANLADYLGLPTINTGDTVLQSENISALPFRAYQKIYNEYYRDQNLEPEIVIPKTDGNQQANIADLTSLRARAYEKDYFTSALPWAQRGPEIQIPQEVIYKDISTVINNGTDTPAAAGALHNDATGQLQSPGVGGPFSRIENIESISEMTINDLRKSVRLQEWLEKNARGGARYVEQLLSHWGVNPGDYKLQRPQYLGGGKQPVTISEVLSAFENTDTALGQMGGHGVSVGRTNGFSHTFKEHGYVIGIMSVTPVPGYAQGIPKHWSRTDKLEYAWPEFANLGEQEVKSKELYNDYTNSGTTNEETFGYQSRYAEYKYGRNRICGSFRTSLDYWHTVRSFATRPVLNNQFVKVSPSDATRIFAIQNPGAEQFYVQIYNKVDAYRPLPYYGVPTL